MYPVVAIASLQIKGRRIDEIQISEAWKTLSVKPLPKILALELRDEDFNYIIDMRRCPEDQLREIEEWGRVLSTKGTDACVFNADVDEDADYVILVRENPYHTLDEIIIHELSHIAKGDL